MAYGSPFHAASDFTRKRAGTALDISARHHRDFVAERLIASADN